MDESVEICDLVLKLCPEHSVALAYKRQASDCFIGLNNRRSANDPWVKYMEKYKN